MTKTTPWDEAFGEIVEVAVEGYLEGPRSTDGAIEEALKRALATLSRLGYRLVPAEATPEMVNATAEADSCVASYEDTINAATEAGDVLREGK